MLINHYNPTTREYLGTSEARENPLEPGQFLIPAHATTKSLPTLKSSQTVIFVGDDWQVVSDYRGQTVCTLDADGHYAGPAVLSLGENPDARRILAAQPAADLPRPKWDGTTWIDGRTTDEILASYETAIEARLDQFAQSRGYRHGDRLASYKGSANATWAAEADRFIELREPTWTKFISISDDIKSGKRPMPELDELLAELPALTWA